MNKCPLISLIIPIYNVEKYLKECVDSIIVQSYRNLEIILVDDGSPDGSGKICDEFAENDERIIVIHKSNGGLSDARNAGFEICKGEIVIFIDSDDFISPIFVDAMVKPIIDNKADMTVLKRSSPFFDGEIVNLASSIEECQPSIHSSKDALEMMLYQNLATGAPFKVCKRDVFKFVKFPKGYLYEDVATTYKEFFYADKVAIIDADLYAYRERHDSITHQKFNPEKMITLEIRKQLLTDNRLIEMGLQNAATSRVFQMEFNVFLQVPKENIEFRKELWKAIKEDREVVLGDTNKLITKKNKCGAMITYTGMALTHFISNCILHR